MQRLLQAKNISTSCKLQTCFDSLCCIAGQGVVSEVNGRTVAVGNLRLLDAENINCHTLNVRSMNDESAKEGGRP